MRIRTWTPVQWLGASAIASLPLMLLFIGSGFRPDGWQIALIVSIISTFFAFFFVEWSDETEYNSAHDKEELEKTKSDKSSY